MRFLRVIVSILLLAAAIGASVFMLWPDYQEFVQLREQVRELQQRLDRGEVVLNQLKEMRRQVEAHQRDFEKISIAIPKETELPAVYDLLQNLGASSGVAVRSIEANPIIEEDKEAQRKVGAMALSVELSGSYDGLKNFLSAVRRSARVLNVQSVKVIEPQVKIADTLEIEVEMNMYSSEKEL